MQNQQVEQFWVARLPAGMQGFLTAHLKSAITVAPNTPHPTKKSDPSIGF
ncbi:MAG: hypothetical protein Q8S54_01020 [Bacteroidota bacterium]|nr:hypothetical protein [Bacteroidota bacterium]